MCCPLQVTVITGNLQLHSRLTESKRDYIFLSVHYIIFHPSIVHCLSGVGSRGQQLSCEAQTFLYRATGGDPEAASQET